MDYIALIEKLLPVLEHVLTQLNSPQAMAAFQHFVDQIKALKASHHP